MSSEYCAGIDLGTTNTVCAVWPRDDQPHLLPLRQPERLKSGRNSQVPAAFVEHEDLPSVVYFAANGSTIVGRAAKAKMLAGDRNCYGSFKRQMGRRWARDARGVRWTPESMSACVLRAVRDELIRQLDGPPSTTVITVPASFGTEARAATIAGFDPSSIQLFDEPSAALLSEVAPNSHPASEPKRKRCMVVDIGGGTLDVSIVDVLRSNGSVVFDLVGQSRRCDLAGDDFDLNIAGLLLDRYEDEHGETFEAMKPRQGRLVAWSLMHHAEHVKKRLSTALKGRSHTEWGRVKEVVNLKVGRGWRTEVSGVDLAAALMQYFPLGDSREARSADFSFFRPIEECLASASRICGGKVTAQSIDEAWLAGGSAYLPMVQLAVHRLLLKEPGLITRPMAAIAIGAALRAGGLAGYGLQAEVKERLFDSIYLQRGGSDGFLKILDERDQVPGAKNRFENALLMPSNDRRVALNLFSGLPAPWAEDGAAPRVRYQPIARRTLDFDRLLERGLPMTVTASVTSNREVVVSLEVEYDGAVHTGTAAVELMATDGRQLPALPPVNLVPT